jgi:HlyD family secretion protein
MSTVEGDLHKLRIDKKHRARREKKSAWPWVLLAILLMGGIAGALAWKGANAAVVVQTQPVRVLEGAAARGPTVVLQATGYVMAAHKIELATKVVGRVAWVGVEMGDKVKKDQVLVRLEDEEFKARVTQQQGQLDAAKAKLAELEAGSRPEEIAKATAELDQLKADLANAERNFKRLSELSVQQNVSRQELDDAETLTQSRGAQVRAKQHDLDMWKIGPRKEQIDAQKAVVKQLEGGLTLANVDLANTVIRSPVDGTVLARNVEVGEFVTTGFVGENGAKGYVVSLADLNDLRVELDISQNNFANVVKDQPCTIVTDAYPDRKYEGVVDLISPEANRQKATVAVRVKVAKPDDLLKPEMNATVSFLSTKATTSGPAASMIRIPAVAVKDGAVFVVEDDKAVERKVTTGQKSADGQVEITKGLIGGEDVIVNVPTGLKNGDRVKR